MKKNIAFCLAALLTACSGGGNGSNGVLPQPSSRPQQQGSSAIAVTISIPKRATASSTSRKPMYVSPSTQDIEVLLATAGSGFAGVTPREFSVSGGSANCGPDPVTPSYLRCTATLNNITMGSYDLRVNLYDRPPLDATHPQGTLLSTGDALSVVVNPLQTTQASITAHGVPTGAVACSATTSRVYNIGAYNASGVAVDRVGAYAGVSPTTTWPSSDSNGLAMCAYAVDADGNTITDLPAGYTVTFTTTDPSLIIPTANVGPYANPNSEANWTNDLFIKPFLAEVRIDPTKIGAYPSPGTPAYSIQLMNGATPVGAAVTSTIAILKTDAQGGITMPPNSNVTVHVIGSVKFSAIDMVGQAINNTLLSVLPVVPDPAVSNPVWAKENGSPLAFTITSGSTVGETDVNFSDGEPNQPASTNYLQAHAFTTIHVKVDNAASFPVVIP